MTIETNRRRSLQGIDEVRQTLLEVSLDPRSFPHHTYTPSSTTLQLFDFVLTLRERDCVVLPWKHFKESAKFEMEELVNNHEQQFLDDVAYLKAVVGIGM